MSAHSHNKQALTCWVTKTHEQVLDSMGRLSSPPEEQARTDPQHVEGHDEIVQEEQGAHTSDHIIEPPEEETALEVVTEQAPHLWRGNHISNTQRST